MDEPEVEMAEGLCDVPVWARDRRRRRPALTRDSIVEAAITIADAEGLDAVSIRRVAAELRARTMSIYTHIDRKEDLFDLMSDALCAEVLLDAAELTDDWRASITAIACRERETMLRHPWLGDLVGRRTAIGPNTLKHLEQSLVALDGLHVDSGTAAQIAGAVDNYMLGYVMLEVTARRGGLASQAYLKAIAQTGDYPRLTPLLVGAWPTEGSFERGLTWLLDGIERDLATRPEP